MKLACQEHLIPGDDLGKKWQVAQAIGFDGIELRGHGDFAFQKRLPELRKARREGAVFPSVCVIMDHFIADFDHEKRLDALKNMKSLLSVIAELGGRGAITPASYGMHSNSLPPYRAPRTPQEDEEILLEALHTLGEHAEREGVWVLLEPLNRYEDHMLNTLDRAVDLCKKVSLDSVRVMADLFHMNIEERDSAAALIAAKDYLAHVHLADSNRLQPGLGQIRFEGIFQALRDIDYDGFLAVECRLHGEATEVLRKVASSFKNLAG
jgi:sugar phosphate isomerase/epimerase